MPDSSYKVTLFSILLNTYSYTLHNLILYFTPFRFNRTSMIGSDSLSRVVLNVHMCARTYLLRFRRVTTNVYYNNVRDMLRGDPKWYYDR